QVEAILTGGGPQPASPMPEKSFASAIQHVDPAEAGYVSAIRDDGHVRTLLDVEKEMILLAVNRYDSQMSEVARRLGIGRSTLYRKLKELGIKHFDDAE